MIEWGESAIGPGMSVAGVAPGSGSEVTVLIWQDQGISEIAYVARGTTVGQVKQTIKGSRSDAPHCM